MQGRLIDSPNGQLDWFPQDSWEDEFNISSELGIDFIELVSEKNHNKENPIWSKKGRLKIKHLIKKNKLKQPYLCFNFMMNNSILKQTTLLYFKELLEVCNDLKIKNIILPFFDKSLITDSNFKIISEQIKSISKLALKNKISIILETAISGNKMMKFINNINMENVSILVDSGNYFEFGFDLVKDLNLFKNFIGHVHIKDKDNYGNNVVLGTGGVDFKVFFDELKKINYNYNYTFETTRGNNALNNARFNLLFFKKHFNI